MTTDSGGGSGSTPPTYSVQFTHPGHNHSSFVRFSSTSYPTGTFTLVSSPTENLASNCSWSVSSGFGAFVNSTVNPAVFSWNTSTPGTGTISVSYLRLGVSDTRQMPFEVVNNPLTLTPNQVIIPTNAVPPFLAFPDPALPTNTLVSWPSYVISATNGGTFNTTNRSANQYTFVAQPNDWCSLARGTATVYVCDASLTVPVLSHANNTMPGAVILRSASTSDCSRLVPLNLNLIPSMLPTGTLTLAVEPAAATNHYAVWTNALKLGSPLSFPTNWPATNHPAALYIEGVSTSSTPRDLCWTLSYLTNLATSAVVTDVLYTTVLDVQLDAYATDKSTRLTNTLKRTPGIVLSRNAADADANGALDAADATFNGPADAADMGLVVFRQMPGITNFAGLSNVVVQVSGNIRLFRNNPAIGESCLVSGCGDAGIPAFINIASQISTGDVRMLVEGAGVGTAGITLSLCNDANTALTNDSATVTMLAIPEDRDEDGLCEHSGGSLNSPAVTRVDPVSFTPWTTVELGRGSLPCGLTVCAYLTAWQVSAIDTNFLRQNMYSLDTRLLPDTGDGFTRGVRPGGRVVAFSTVTGLPQMPDLGRTYRLIIAGGNYVLVFASGYKHYFDMSSGALCKVEDPNGTQFAVVHANWPAVTRNGAACVTAASSPGYGDSGALVSGISYLSNQITSVTSALAAVTFTNNGCLVRTTAGADTHTTTITPGASIVIDRDENLRETWSVRSSTPTERVISCVRTVAGAAPAQTDYHIPGSLLGERIDQVTTFGSCSNQEAALATTYGFQTDPARPGFGQVQWIIPPDSGFTYLTYDSFNRVTNTLRGIGNARQDRNLLATAAAPDPAACQQTTLAYGGDDSSVDFNRPRTIATFYQGTPVGRAIHVFAANYRETQVATSPAAAGNDAGNLKTIVNFDPANPGLPLSIVDPCGNTTTFANQSEGSGVAAAASIVGDPAGEGSITHYNSRGQIWKTERTANGVPVAATTNLFDGLGHLLATTYADARRDLYQYDAWGFCTLNSNREGVVSTFLHDKLLRLTNSLCNGVTTRYANFDTFGNPRTISTWGAGTEVQTTTRAFDGASRLLSETDPFGHTNTFVTIVDITGAPGNRTITTRGDHTTIEETYRDGTPVGAYGNATHPVAYQTGITNGRLYSATVQFPTLWVTNDLVTPASTLVTNRTDAVTIDFAGRQNSTINADASANVRTTDRAGRTTCFMDEGGHRNFFEYDPAGRLSRMFVDMNDNGICDVGDKWTRWTRAFATFSGLDVFRTDIYCSDLGNSESMIGSSLERVDGKGSWTLDAFGKTTSEQTSYTGAQRTSTVTLPNGTASQVISVSNLVKSVQGATESAPTSVKQDGFLRTSVVTAPRVGATTIAYAQAVPGAVNRVTVAAPDGTTSSERDLYGQPTKTTLPDGVVRKRNFYTTGEDLNVSGGHEPPQSFEWLATGEQTALNTFRNWNTTNAFNSISDATRWEYNLQRGWPTAKVYADGTRHAFGYQANGWLASRTDARSISTAYGRDAAGQLCTRLYSDGTPGVTNTWNQRDLVIAVTDAAGQRTNQFDAGGRLTSTVVAGPVNHGLAITYCTNSDERADCALILGASNVFGAAYVFDSAGRLSAISARCSALGTTNPLVFSYAWLTNATLISSITFPNGVTNQFSYQTNADRVAAIRVWPRFATPPVGAAAAPVLEYGYMYDSIGRCTNYSRPYESTRDQYAYDYDGHLVRATRQACGTWTTNQWYFDTIGNRVAEANALTGVLATHAFNGLNQNRSLAYDANGNILTNGNWNYAWDAENRLIAAESGSGVPAAVRRRLTFQYDSQNRRIGKQVYSWSSGAWQQTTDASFIYDGWNLVAETISNQQSAITNLFIWGPDHTGSLAADSGGVRGLLAIINGANVFYPVMNNHGDVTALFDATGTNIVARYERDPFGTLLSATGPAVGVCPIGFQTKYCDPETGLVYFGHRYYSPTLGIFISRDPLQEKGGVNLYGYGKGCPLAVDELGLFDVPTHGNITISAMTELNGKLGLTRAQYNDLLRGVCEGSSFPDTQTRIRLPPGCTLPIMQDIQRFDHFVDYPADQAKKGLKFASKKMGELNTAAIGLVWADYPRLNNGVMNWWDHGPSFLGPAFAWGSKYSAKVDVLNQTHFGPLAWQHGMSEEGMTADGLQSQIIAGSMENMKSYGECAGKGNYYDAGFALGKTLHYIQDTYTPSHAERDVKTGQITAFFDYISQSPALHTTEDKPAFGGPVYKTAVQQSQVLILMFLNGKTADIPGLFQLAPRVQIGEPGPFVTDKEIIPPMKLLQGDWR